MEPRAKKIIVIIGSIVALVFIAVIVYALLAPKYPATQASEKTVIIDNYKEYTDHISSDSFGHFGNSLYQYIKDPNQSVYHAVIVDGSYSYDKSSWFSNFTVKLNNSDVSWKVKMQTLKGGGLNGDLGITCASGPQCLAVSDRMPSALQDYLPITTGDFVIAYQKDISNISIVYYDQPGEGKTKALEKIKALGFKPEDYKIEYFYGGR